MSLGDGISMIEEDSLLLYLGLFLPSILILIFTSIGLLLLRNFQSSKERQVNLSAVRPAALRSGSRRGLETSLDSATELNAFVPGVNQDNVAHLQDFLRLAPDSYQAAIPKISQQFRGGRAISVDLGRMDYHQAARLVDFCSGMTAFSSGWIFRVSDDVIILAPGTL